MQALLKKIGISIDEKTKMGPVPDPEPEAASDSDDHAPPSETSTQPDGAKKGMEVDDDGDSDKHTEPIRTESIANGKVAPAPMDVDQQVAAVPPDQSAGPAEPVFPLDFRALYLPSEVGFYQPTPDDVLSVIRTKPEYFHDIKRKATAKELEKNPGKTEITIKLDRNPYKHALPVTALERVAVQLWMHDDVDHPRYPRLGMNSSKRGVSTANAMRAVLVLEAMRILDTLLGPEVTALGDLVKPGTRVSAARALRLLFPDAVRQELRGAVH